MAPHMLTRDDEIAILREAVEKLGPKSYCGPWLAEQIVGIEHDIRSDLFPQTSRAAAVLQCTQIRLDADEAASAKIRYAEQQARAIVEKARNDERAIRSRLHAELLAAANGMRLLT